MMMSESGQRIDGSSIERLYERVSLVDGVPFTDIWTAEQLERSTSVSTDYYSDQVRSRVGFLLLFEV